MHIVVHYIGEENSSDQRTDYNEGEDSLVDRFWQTSVEEQA